ncbi:hypothetical protein JQS43_19160 [Natronosporangium hydrolyticum]|uniref:Uncharacterized protein n=1 Tax=Natronosporangium hydrolyticum TaxID=2811111 RepID=A0A895YGL7_9ACTN|nr:hypothetical protein [Natronosporangium hydrolyticum]QSB13676.1 hypothetical protein JQS43_19160 [Natronosporangium hydrolyticum]
MTAFFAAEWEWAATIEEAQRIVGVLEDPTQTPSDAELERLAGFFYEHADDEEFSYFLLSDLGPDGLIKANQAVVELQDHADLDVLVRIQEGLG